MGHHVQWLREQEKPARSLAGALSDLAVLALNLTVVVVFGAQNLSSYFPSTEPLSLPLGILCVLLTPLVCLQMVWLRKSSGSSWHERYGSTPVWWILLGIYFLCFWSFAIHAAQLIFTSDCDICAGNPASGKRFFRPAFWLHVYPSLVIALASPLQYTPSIRRFCGYLLHRWVGRVVLLASVVHQASATVLFVSEIYFSMPNRSLAGWQYRIYVSGFIPKNLLCWTSIVMGFVTARQGRFAEHGRWMCRLGAMWVITIVVAHLIIYPVGWAVGPQWKYAAGEWAEWLFVIPMEIYIRKSGRFEKKGPSAKSTVPPEFSTKASLEAPFLVEQP